MIYPFYWTVLGKLNDLSYELLNKSYEVWGDWKLEAIKAPQIDAWVNLKPDMVHGGLFISVGDHCDYHLDRFSSHMVKHRILIPLDSNYVYEWKTEDNPNQVVAEMQPEVGNIYLFNNMVPHRFRSLDGKVRRTIYFDMWDKKLAPYLPHFTETFSAQNALLRNL